MPEGMNIEIAHKLAESEHGHGPTPSRWAEVIEIAEAVVLALVAVATAWCGYHSAMWDGRQAFLYGTSARLRVEAAALRGCPERKSNGGKVLRLLAQFTKRKTLRKKREKRYVNLGKLDTTCFYDSCSFP
jgi:hypothetical protein